MPTFKLEVETDGREVYRVDAETKEEAEAIFNRGDAGRPDVSEVTGAEVIEITVEES